MIETGLFDMRISANVETQDSWNFVCTLTTDEPHVATCTLTFEEPDRLEGPAWVRMVFRDVASQEDTELDGPLVCIAPKATIVGTYFYDANTNDAGVYSFYATAQ
mmetsp:Transcript_60089/g.82315  ORF Transcript_60089/g.82315 Transcript_60089/m.82315 type:complete len:105 (-) Transcript_60089:409-723(-)